MSNSGVAFMDSQSFLTDFLKTFFFFFDDGTDIMKLVTSALQWKLVKQLAWLRPQLLSYFQNWANSIQTGPVMIM